MALVGREAERGVLDRVVAERRGGRRHTVVVLGEPGIGKSALLGEAVAEAERAGLLVLSAQAAEREREVPYALIVEALEDQVASMSPARLRATGPELASLFPAAFGEESRPSVIAVGPSDRLAQHRAVSRLLAQLGRERVVLLVLDDLQWADEASLEVVIHVLRRPDQTAPSLVLACRPSDAADRLLDAARHHDDLTELPLAPLPDAAARALLPHDLDPQTTTRILEQAQGNPLFLRELGRAADGGNALTATIVGAVRREIAALSPATRALLEGAAAAGEPFDVELAAAAADISRTDALDLIDRLHAVDLIRGAPDSGLFTFRHPLVRRAVYESAPPGFRVAAHERLAIALAETGAPPAARAYHVQRSARPGDETAIAALVAAAEASFPTAPAISAHWYQEALRLLPYGDDERRAQLLAMLARGLAAGGKLREARLAVLEALTLVPPQTSALRAELVYSCAALENLLGRHQDARRRLTDGLSSVPDADRERLEWALADTLFYTGDVTEMADRAEQLLATPTTSRVVRAGAVGLRAMAGLFNGQAAKDELDGALAELNEAPDAELAERLGVIGNITVAARLSERVDPAAEALHTRFQALAREAGLGQLAALAGTTLAWFRLDRLELELALEELETAEELAQLSGGGAMVATNLRLQAQARELRGDAAGARRLAAATLGLEARPDASGLVWTSRLVALIVLHRGDPRRLLDEFPAAELESSSPSDAVWLALQLTRAAVRASDSAAARRWSTFAAERGAAASLPLAISRALQAEAECALGTGDTAGALRRARDAEHAARTAGGRLDEMESAFIASRACLASGDTTTGIPLMQAVAERAGTAGAAGIADAAARELRRTGTRVNRRAAGAVAASREGSALTRREQEIVDLVIAGRSNKEVAATLFLSEKTIENNLSRVYAKLDVRSRTELVAAMESRRA